MTLQTRRLLTAIVAWPVGLLVAVALLFLPLLTGSTSCPSGESCALQPVPLWKNVAWLAIAFGPGVVATRAWWRGRREAP